MRGEKVLPVADFITLHIFASDYTAPEAWRLLKWCQKNGADEWTIDPPLKEKGSAQADALEATVGPCNLPTAKRRRLTATGRRMLFVRSTRLWKMNSAAYSALQPLLPDGPFTFRTGRHGWLEDLTLYRNTELMLGIVSHEHEGILRVTAAEREDLDRQVFHYHFHGKYVGY